MGMIENIVLLLRGLVNGTQPAELLAKVNPIGIFPNMKSVLTFDANDKEGGLVRLFETVLIDTPVGHLFERYFVDSEQSDDKDIFSSLGKIDLVETSVKRLWLQEFYDFCRQLGGETAEQMCELLEFEADKNTIRIMVNSFGTSLAEAHQRDFRQKLFASFGQLYPEGISKFYAIEDLSELGRELMKYERLEKYMMTQPEGKKISKI